MAKCDNIWLDGHLNFDLTGEITKMNDSDEGSWISVIKILHTHHVCMMQQPEDGFFFFFDEQSLWLMCNQNLNLTCS